MPVKCYRIITYKYGVYKLPDQLQNDIRLGILGN